MVQQAGAKVKLEMQTTSLWNDDRNLMKLLIPLYKALHISDQAGPAMAVLDGKMRGVREVMINFKTNNYVTTYAFAIVSSCLIRDGNGFVTLYIGWDII